MELRILYLAKSLLTYVSALRLSFLTRGWLIGCSAHLTLITANKNYQIPDSTKRIRAQPEPKHLVICVVRMAYDAQEISQVRLHPSLAEKILSEEFVDSTSY